MAPPSIAAVSRPTPPSWRQYWWWFAAALCLLLAVDLLTTLGAVAIHGLGAEYNPIMRMLLERGLAATVVVHLAIVFVATAGFAIVLTIGDSLDGAWRRRYQLCFEIWLAALIVTGIIVAANNLAVIMVGVLTP